MVNEVNVAPVLAPIVAKKESDPLITILSCKCTIQDPTLTLWYVRTKMRTQGQILLVRQTASGGLAIRLIVA